MDIYVFLEIFREAGYFTAHIGKWHLGGMREEQRLARLKGKCNRPGPNQHGFEEYVSMLDGPDSPRYKLLHHQSLLHTEGHKYFLRNDRPMKPPPNNDGSIMVLSDSEANEAIRILKEGVTQRPNKPFFMQVWFNAPHSPWQLLPTGQSIYNKTIGYDLFSNFSEYKCNGEKLFNTKEWKYKSMVTAMDISIGRILDTLTELKLDENTLVIFTSDNGFERGAGAAGFFREGKRSLMEGGVRVPCIWLWKGIVPANHTVSYWGAQTDLIPTFLEAAGISKPQNFVSDGISLLPILLSNNKKLNKKKKNFYLKDKLSIGKKLSSSRLYLWHRDTEPYDGYDGRVNSAGYIDNVKVITKGHSGVIYKIFDMKLDPYESNNLLNTKSISIDFNNFKSDLIRKNLKLDPMVTSKCVTYSNKTTTDICERNYLDSLGVRVIFIMQHLYPFVKVGNAGHIDYMKHRQHKAICDVPIASQIIPLKFGPRNCTFCSIPSY